MSLFRGDIAFPCVFLFIWVANIRSCHLTILNDVCGAPSINTLRKRLFTNAKYRPIRCTEVVMSLFSISVLPTKVLKHKGLIADSWRSTKRPAIQSLAPDTSFKHKFKRCRLHSITIGRRRTELCSETHLSPPESVDCLWRILPYSLFSHRDFDKRLLGASEGLCR